MWDHSDDFCTHKIIYMSTIILAFSTKVCIFHTTFNFPFSFNFTFLSGALGHTLGRWGLLPALCWVSLWEVLEGKDYAKGQARVNHTSQLSQLTLFTGNLHLVNILPRGWTIMPIRGPIKDTQEWWPQIFWQSVPLMKDTCSKVWSNLKNKLLTLDVLILCIMTEVFSKHDDQTNKMVQ